MLGIWKIQQYFYFKPNNLKQIEEQKDIIFVKLYYSL
jgi:hypothetical protein